MVRKTSPELARASALAIVRALRSAGHIAYFAGGCVRDELLGLDPTDYDIATDATPQRIQSLFKRTNEVGAAFGVVLVTPSELLPDPATVEVATFRSDGPYSDRRRPDAVTFSDPQADARRRDFTINALFLDPLEGAAPGSKAGGRVIDFVDGQQDLARRLIRAVGDPDARLAEDHLRALRAIRLGARLGFALDPGTSAAIVRHASDLKGVSRERIGEEVRKMLSHPSRAQAAELLEHLSLDAPILNEPHAAGTRTMLRAMSTDDRLGYPTYLAAWACDRGLTPSEPHITNRASRWRSALCLSNDERGQMVQVLHVLHELETSWQSLTIAGRKRLAGLNAGFHGGFALLGARNPGRQAEIRSEVASLAQTPSGLAPMPLITGDDLIAAGFVAGPAFKGLLDAVYDAQLEDKVKTPAEALELARRLRV